MTITETGELSEFGAERGLDLSFVRRERKGYRQQPAQQIEPILSAG
jgi:hypothetical protein